MKTIKATKYALTWHRPGELNFYIRWIDQDGAFFGEIEDYALRLLTNVNGQIPSEQWARCKVLISQIEFQANPAAHVPAVAILAPWTEALGSPDSIFRYNLGDELTSASARLFLVVKDIVAHEVLKGYPESTRQPPA